MGIVIFFLLALIVAGVIAYPLLPGRTPSPPVSTEAQGHAVTGGEIERTVRALRRARQGSGHHCPACSQAYQPGDRFCVRCGGTLPQVAAAGPACPACGVSIREGDVFCPKCGQSLPKEGGTL